MWVLFGIWQYQPSILYCHNLDVDIKYPMHSLRRRKSTLERMKSSNKIVQMGDSALAMSEQPKHREE